MGLTAPPLRPVLALSSGELTMLVAIVALVAFSVFLAVAETALTRINRAKAGALADDGRKGSRALLQLVDDPESWINPLLLTVLACQLVQASLTGILADHLFGTFGVIAGVVFNVVVVFVVAESLPKTWTVLHTERAALLSAPFVEALVRFPPLRLASRGLGRVSRAMLPGSSAAPEVSEEELLALADVAVAEEVLETDERALIGSIIEFGDTIVREVMVPRPDMVTVDADYRVADVMEIVILNGYSRVPALGEGIDDVVGLVYAKDLMKAERDGAEDAPVSHLLRPARFVPESKRVPDLLREMQRDQFHMAIVIDEYGGTAGLVTLEDVIEELVGEIVDEFDHEEALVEPLPGGGIRVNARMAILEVNEVLHADLPEGDWDSVGGLVYHVLGRPPTEGETVRAGEWLLRAERISGRRIGRVSLRPADPAVRPADSAAPAPAGERAR